MPLASYVQPFLPIGAVSYPIADVAVGVSSRASPAWWMLVCLLCALVYWLCGRFFYRLGRGPQAALYVALALVALGGAMLYAESNTFALRYPLLSLPIQVLFLLFFYLFADRRFASSRIRWLTILFVLTQLGTLAPGKQPPAQATAGMNAVPGVLGALALVGDVLAITVVVLGIVPQLYRRYRALVACGLWRGDWGVSRRLLVIVGLGGALLLGISALFEATAQPHESPPYLVARTVFYLLATLGPVAAAYALLAAPPLDWAALMRRTIMSGLLVLCLLVIFALCIAAAAFAVPGFATFSPLEYLPFVILIAVLQAALFRPLRAQIQDRVDWLIYPTHYKARHYVAALRANMSTAVQLEQLGDELATTLERALDATGVALWLPSPTATSAASSARMGMSLRRQAAVGALAETSISSFDIETGDSLTPWLSAPAHFVALDHLDVASSQAAEALSSAGVTHLLTFAHAGGLAGVLGLGGSAAARRYTVDDADLLMRLADEITPTLQLAAEAHWREVAERQRERVEQELQTARRIQESLLPKEIPALDGWQIATHYQPAREVGGDFYDLIPLAQGRLGVVLGDVTDKGIPAALVMATTRSMLRAAATQPHATPGEVLAQVNDLLCPDLPSGMFVTCFYAILDPATGAVIFANAGQDPPYLRRSDNSMGELYATGMPLGLMPGMRYDVREGTVEQGERLVFFSDGLVEAHNRAREMFGLARVQAVLRDLNGATPISSLLGELARFTGPEWEQEDDVTLVSVERLAPVALASAETDHTRAYLQLSEARSEASGSV